MALKVKWSKRADHNFDHIVHYLSEEWSETAARSFVRKTFHFLEVLSEFPKIGSLQINQRGVRGFTLVKQVVVFYRVESDCIILLDFFQTAQNPQKKDHK